MKGFVYSALLVGGLVTHAIAVAPSEVNLLRNSSFEKQAVSGGYNEAEFWRIGHPDEQGHAWGSASRENWRAYDGEFIATVRGIWAAQGTFGGWWQDAAATPGQTYRFSGWFYCDPEWSARKQLMKLEFWDTTKQNLLMGYSIPIRGCDIDWMELVVEGVAPEGTAWVRVVVDVDKVGAMGSLQLDALSLITIEP